MYDVIIIGAGVIGGYLSSELAKMGHQVCVLEKNGTAGTKTSCTGIISRECFDLLSPTNNIVQCEAHSAKIYAPSGRFMRIERQAPQAYILDRPALDRYIVSLAEKHGAEFRFSASAAEIKRNRQSIQVLATVKGEPVTLTARMVIATCGFGSAFINSCGLGRIHYYAQGAQALVDCPGVDEVEVYSNTELAPGFFSWLVPTGSSLAKAGLLCHGNPGPYMRKLLNMLQQQGRINTSDYEISYGTVPLSTLSRTYADRILVVGDAAGQVKPTSGGGIYFGLLCAAICVQTVHDALSNDDLSSKSLSAYQKQWHKVLKRELAVDFWAHRFYSKLNNRQIEHIFNVIERHGIHQSILDSPDISFDWHGKVILDAIKHRSIQRSLTKLDS